MEGVVLSVRKVFLVRGACLYFCLLGYLVRVLFVFVEFIFYLGFWFVGLVFVGGIWLESG